jgi:hypothetical protein
MMKQVYILWQGREDEEFSIWGIFASMEAAEFAKKKLENLDGDTEEDVFFEMRIEPHYVIE